jgi:two-component system, NtrC family, response regulator AtoC
MVSEGKFREDLFYRLNVIPIHLPPLRDRKEDIPPLVLHFLQRFCRDLPQAARPGTSAGAGPGGRVGASAPPRMMTVSQQAMRLLMAFGWPGNVRQLENALERAVALSSGRTQIEVSDLPPEIQQAGPATAARDLSLPEDGMDFQLFIHNIEREIIEQSLDRTHGNKGQAAKLLKLKRTTLVEKLKRLRDTEL